MGKKTRRTSPKVASQATSIFPDPKSTKAEQSVAASDRGGLPGEGQTVREKGQSDSSTRAARGLSWLIVVIVLLFVVAGIVGYVVFLIVLSVLIALVTGILGFVVHPGFWTTGGLLGLVLVAGILAFVGLSGTLAFVAKILLIVFLALLVVGLILNADGSA